MPATGPPSSRLTVSPRLLAVAVGAALLIAAAFLAAIVLPAAHGLDPLGLGAATGTLRTGTDAAAAPSPIEQTFRIGENRSYGYSFDLPGGHAAELTWNATAPVDVTIETHTEAGTAPGAPAPSMGERSGDTRIHATEHTTVTLEWTNPNPSPVTIRLAVQFAAAEDPQ